MLSTGPVFALFWAISRRILECRGFPPAPVEEKTSIMASITYTDRTGR